MADQKVDINDLVRVKNEMLSSAQHDLSIMMVQVEMLTKKNLELEAKLKSLAESPFRPNPSMGD